MLSLPTEQIKREDEVLIKEFMLIIRKLRKDLLFRRKDFASFLGIRDDIYIKFETTGKAATTTLFRLFKGLSLLGVNINKLLSLKNLSEYDIHDLMDVYDWSMAMNVAGKTRLRFKRYKQRRKENIGPPYFFKNITVEDAIFEKLEYERRYGKKPKELTEEEKEEIRNFIPFEINLDLSMYKVQPDGTKVYCGRISDFYTDLEIDK